MIGAVVFVIFFLAFLAVTLGMPTLPPGNMIHDLLNIPVTVYPVLGIPSWLLINAIVNGVVYGFIIWIIFTVVSAATGRGKKEQQIQAPANLTSDTQEELTEHKDKTHKV